MWSLNWIIQTTAVSPPPVLFVRLSADLQRNKYIWDEIVGRLVRLGDYMLSTLHVARCIFGVPPCTTVHEGRTMLQRQRAASYRILSSVGQAVGSFQRGDYMQPFFDDATGQGREGLMAAEATGGDRRAVLILWISL